MLLVEVMMGRLVGSYGNDEKRSKSKNESRSLNDKKEIEYMELS